MKWQCGRCADFIGMASLNNPITEHGTIRWARNKVENLGFVADSLNLKDFYSSPLVLR